MRYKGYSAVIEYDETGRIFHGRVIGLKDVINFYGSTPDELEQEFKNSVDDYLEFCKEQNKKPEKTYSGQFIIRTTRKNHQLIDRAAHKAGQSINKWVENVLLEKAKEYENDERILK